MRMPKRSLLRLRLFLSKQSGCVRFPHRIRSRLCMYIPTLHRTHATTQFVSWYQWPRRALFVDIFFGCPPRFSALALGPVNLHTRHHCPQVIWHQTSRGLSPDDTTPELRRYVEAACRGRPIVGYWREPGALHRETMPKMTGMTSAKWRERPPFGRRYRLKHRFGSRA